MFYEMLKIAFRSIWGQKLRSSLVALGVAIGVIAVAGMTTMALSLQSELKQQLSTMGSETFMVMRVSPMNFIGGKHRGKMRQLWRRPRLELNYLKSLQNGCPDCKLISPVASYHGKNASLGKEHLETEVVGVTPEYNGIVDMKLGFGRFINISDVERSRYVCIVGQTIVEDLFGGGNPIGRKIKVNNIPFLVVGVLEPIGEFMGQDKDNTVIVPVTTALHHWRGWWGIQYYVKAKHNKIVAAEDEITAVLRRLRKLKGSDPNDFDIFTSELMLAFLTTILASVYAVGVGIALMSLLVAGIGIMNVMFVSVAERTKEIGIRKACGAKPKIILTQFTIEAAILSLFGGVIGLLSLYIIAILVGKFLPFEVSLKIPVLIFGLLFSAFAGILFGYFPAKKASKMPPVEALRWE
ncbi:ABC transporter permease [bacterium]|nr:ABC transporter permease [bacterium]